MFENLNKEYPLGSSAHQAPLLQLIGGKVEWRCNCPKTQKWRVVYKGPYTFIEDDGKPKDVDDLGDAELHKLNYNNWTMKTIMTGV